MSSGKVFFPVMTSGAVSSGASAAGLTTGAAHVASAAAGGLATAATGTGIALLAVGAAATAVVITRIAMGAIHDSGRTTVADAEEWKHLEAATEWWQGALLDVVDQNARIATIRAATRRLGRTDGSDGGPDLPDPLNPTGLAVEQLRDWCVRIGKHLDRAERELAQLTVTVGLDWLSDQTDEDVVTAAQALAGHKIYSRPAASWPLEPEFAEVVGQVAARLPSDVSAEDYASVLEAGAKATSVDSLAAARTWLAETRKREQDAVQRAGARREGVQSSVRYLTALRLDEISPDLFPPERLVAFAPVIARLEAVLAGTAELTPELQRAAEDARLQAQTMADECLMAETMRESLMQLGYAVTPGPPGLFEATGTDWGDHAVQFDRNEGEVTATLMRDHQPAATIDPGLLRRWRHDYARLAAGVAEAGVSLDLINAMEPTTVHHDEEVVQAARTRTKDRP
jgi:hypothetical protein